MEIRKHPTGPVPKWGLYFYWGRGITRVGFNRPTYARCLQESLIRECTDNNSSTRPRCMHDNNNSSTDRGARKTTNTPTSHGQGH